jgi:hypothetical protein
MKLFSSVFSESDVVDILGILAVASLLASYGLSRSPYSSFVYGIAWTIGALFMAAIGIWPIAVIQAMLALLVFRRHWRRKHEVNVFTNNRYTVTTGAALGEDHRRAAVEQD